VGDERQVERLGWVSKVEDRPYLRARCVVLEKAGFSHLGSERYWLDSPPLISFSTFQASCPYYECNDQ
jgi:hypothetical protein